jgi:hypothetical protein
MSWTRGFCVLAAPVALWLGFSFGAPQKPALSTEEIVSKALNARGGLSRIKAVQSQRITGTIYFDADTHGPFVAEFQRPGKMHNEVTIQDKVVVRVLDGKESGWQINPFAGITAPEAMSAEDVKNAASEADFDGPIVDAKTKGNTLEFVGMEKVEDRDAYKLKVTHQDGKVFFYSFDTQTFLLTKWLGTRDNGGQEVTWETFFHDYREVDGLKFAFELVSDSPGTEYMQKIVVDKIEVNPQIDQSHFKKPPAPATTPASTPIPRPSLPPGALSAREEPGFAAPRAPAR